MLGYNRPQTQRISAKLAVCKYFMNARYFKIERGGGQSEDHKPW